MAYFAKPKPPRKLNIHEKINLRSWLNHVIGVNSTNRAHVLVRLPIKEVAALDYKMTGRSFTVLAQQHNHRR